MPDNVKGKMGIIERLLSLFVTPSELMRNISLKPVVLAPMLVCLLISAASLPLTLRQADLQTRWMSYVSIERYGVDFFNLAQADDEDAEDQTVPMITRVSTIAGLLVNPPLSAFISAIGLYLLTEVARGKEIKLIHYFSMYMHLFIITAIGVAITAFISVTLDTMLDVTSLAALFMPSGDVTIPAYNILSAVTVFNIWITVLTIIGIKHLNGFSYIKSTVIGLLAYSISVAIAATAASLTFTAFDMLNNISFM